MNGLDLLLALKTIRNRVLDGFSCAVTYLGSEEAYLGLIIIVYLCVSRRLGFRLLMMFALSAYAVSVLKELFATQRPFVMYPDIVHPLALSTADGYSIPSGHALLATVVWGYIALQLGSWRWRLAALAVIPLVSFSRVYLHVHWPADMLAGIAIGAGLLVVYVKVLASTQKRELRLSPVVSGVVLAMTAALLYTWGRHLADGPPAAGALLGGGLGYVALGCMSGYTERASPVGQIIKAVSAVAVLLAARYLLAKLLGPASLLSLTGKGEHSHPLRLAIVFYDEIKWKVPGHRSQVIYCEPQYAVFGLLRRSG